MTGIKLSHVSSGNAAQFVLAGVSLESFWPSVLEKPLVYVVRRPRCPSSLTAGRAAALFHDPVWVLYSDIGGNWVKDRIRNKRVPLGEVWSLLPDQIHTDELPLSW